LTETFFGALVADTPTRVWVNNPTLAEIDLALEQGAVGCTTNPAYGGGLLKRAPDEIRPLIAEATRADESDAVVADRVQRRLVARVVERFRRLFDSSGGHHGFVSIQGAPDADDDPDAILAEAHAGRTLGPNATPKLPATGPGLAAFETLVEDGSPTIVTEVFSLAQLVETCERYLAVTERSGARPPFFISPITGILGDHLKAVATTDGLVVDPGDLLLAGVAFARECQRIVEARGYPVTLLCGGARTPFDLLGLVGAPLHATINWSTFAEILDRNPKLGAGFDEPIAPKAIERLAATFADVRRAFAIDGLALDEFEGFGPVQYFRGNFMAGWQAVRQAIAAEREAIAAEPSPVAR
jgi:transaldolase